MKRLLVGGVLLAMLGVTTAWAQADAIRSEPASALRDAQATQTVGPAEIDLANGEAKLQLPADHLFVPMPAAARLLRAMGNTADEHLVGLIYPPRQDNWMLAIQYEDSGHIKDDDARDWDVDQLLRSVSAGTERSNEDRRRFGFQEIQVLGWAEKPRYDAANHRLVWAVAAREKNASPTSDQGVNYNTYVLGRDGYFKFNFVTDLKDLRAQIPAADGIVNSLQYADGKGYGDFNAATDKVANFGVAALVAGFAAKKAAEEGAGLMPMVAEAGVWLVVAMIIVALAFFAWRWWKKRAPRPSKLGADDFPPTEISTVSMDQPTVPMYAHPGVVAAAVFAEAPAIVRPGATAASIAATLPPELRNPPAPPVPPAAPPPVHAASVAPVSPTVTPPASTSAPIAPSAGHAAVPGPAAVPPAAAPLSTPAAVHPAGANHPAAPAVAPATPTPAPAPDPAHETYGAMPPPAWSEPTRPPSPAELDGPLIPAPYAAPPPVVEEGPEPDLGFPNVL